MISEALHFGGETIRVELEVYWNEIERRGGALIEPAVEVLDLLFGLPEGERVPIDELPEWSCGMLSDLPEWAVLRDGDCVVRSYRPPATVQTVLAADSAAPWNEQLQALQWFTALGRALVLVSDLESAFAAIDQCAPLSVGVGVVQPDGTWQTLLEPRISPVQMTSARWHLAEEAVSRVTMPR